MVRLVFLLLSLSLIGCSRDRAPERPTGPPPNGCSDLWACAPLSSEPSSSYCYAQDERPPAGAYDTRVCSEDVPCDASLECNGMCVPRHCDAIADCPNENPACVDHACGYRACSDGCTEGICIHARCYPTWGRCGYPPGWPMQ